MQAINLTAAITDLNTLGLTPTTLAHHLKVHPQTVRRWANGTTHPNRTNHTNLRGLVQDLIRETTGKDVHTAADRHRLAVLERAHRHLHTPTEVAELDRLAADIRRHVYATARATQEAEQALRDTRNTHRPATTRVDPFALCAPTGLDNTIDTVFAGVA